MSSYKILNKQKFSSGEYSIVPIRMEDRYDIMKWRNEQMYHLRQNKVLTKDEQDHYFDAVISKLYKKDKPDQILFSFFKNKELIGYGGLVHINWVDKNAEISFLINTELEEKNFEEYWKNFLTLLENVAWKELNLHKLHTYAFDLRPKIYKVLEDADFSKEAVLKEHCLFNREFIDVVIHSKFNKLWKN
jgi:RimJ/RimL family protein N-acetyltransferase